jgi:hypothetical protein
MSRPRYFTTGWTSYLGRFDLIEALLHRDGIHWCVYTSLWRHANANFVIGCPLPRVVGQGRESKIVFAGVSPTCEIHHCSKCTHVQGRCKDNQSSFSVDIHPD